MDDPRPPLPPSRWRGRMLGCLGIIVLLGVAGSWLWGRASSTLQWGCAQSILWMTETACLRGGLTPEQQTRVMAPVKPFAAGIEQGTLSLGLGLAMLRRLSRGPLPAAFFCRGMADRMTEMGPTGNPLPGSAAALVTTFFDMYKNGRIASGTLRPLQRLLTERREVTFKRPSGMVIRERMRVMKPGFTPEEKEKALALMITAIASAAALAETPAEAPIQSPLPIDPAAELAEAISTLQQSPADSFPIFAGKKPQDELAD